MRFPGAGVRVGKWGNAAQRAQSSRRVRVSSGDVMHGTATRVSKILQV